MAWHKSSHEKIKGVHGKETCVWIYDNGGRTADRYTAVIGCRNGFVVHMSEHPSHPQGVGMYGGERKEYPLDLRYMGKRVKFTKVPKDVKKAIKYYIDGDE